MSISRITTNVLYKQSTWLAACATYKNVFQSVTIYICLRHMRSLCGEKPRQKRLYSKIYKIIFFMLERKSWLTISNKVCVVRKCWIIVIIFCIFFRKLNYLVCFYGFNRFSFSQGPDYLY